MILMIRRHLLQSFMFGSLEDDEVPDQIKKDPFVQHSLEEDLHLRALLDGNILRKPWFELELFDQSCLFVQREHRSVIQAVLV